MIYPFHGQANFARRSVDLRRYRDEFRLRDQPEDRQETTAADDLDKVVTYTGLDLGQLSDPAALVMVRKHRYDERMPGPRWPYLELCRIHTWPPGTTRYEDIVRQSLMLRPDVLCYDYNGVGGNFPFMFRTIARDMRGPQGEQLPPWNGKLVPVQTVGTIFQALTMGMSPEGRFVKISKKDLVTGLNVLSQARVVFACRFCNAVKVGEVAVIRTGEHAGKECKVLEWRDGQWVVAVEGVKHRRYCDANNLYRAKPSQSCIHCAYLRFCLPDPLEGKRLLEEMASFLERHNGNHTTYEHRTTTGHGDRVVAAALAVLMTQQGNRELVMR